ncbi:PQQ-dependent sugar dehydrogenase [Marivirga sp. S37H4]|uniref:PQQ-dependent sugar dehydrogenase n=1 Tax=Marivirga aurantiaca TaxID=2802615 RepID=A0A934X0B3_9BACT|nr:PQQ-dependent sugar dehydrogenase [Marivirga aurantiaca]MBK6266558.1 PQQ-dependent sugar dehydrogenase [Marivirga aurantiaca]
MSYGQQEIKPVDKKIDGHIFKPTALKPTNENISNLKLPKGFQINVFAESLNKPRIIKISDDGTIYITRREDNDLMMLRDTNGDGKADSQQPIWNKDQLHGIAIDGNRMFLITVATVYVANIKEDGTIDEPEIIIEGLPEGGQHPNRTLAIGPDDKLYISVGSTCNACDETSDKNATILRANKDGSKLEIFTKGLRNTIGFDWHPETGELYGMDHGIDWLGDDDQKEELNKIEKDNDYGWPYIYDDSQFNPADEPPNMSYEEYAAKSTEPLLFLTAHSAPMDMIFYEGDMFPKGYQNDAFLALHGSWNRETPVGYKVVRIKFKDGQPREFEDFLSGFLAENNKSQFGRPVGVAQHPDGSLFITDDSGGMVYRISYIK